MPENNWSEATCLRRIKTRAYLLCGPSLSGKSTASRRIIKAFTAVTISSDEINAQRGLPFGAEGLPESVWAETLQIQLAQFRTHCVQGRSVAIDDTLCYRWLRDRWRQEALAANAEPILLVLSVSIEELLARYELLLASAERPVLSRHRFLKHLESFEWPSSEEGAIDISTPAKLDGWLQAEARRQLSSQT